MSWENPAVKEVMSPLSVTARPTETLRQLTSLMTTHHLSNICILDEDKIVGVLSDRDLKQALPSIPAGAQADTYETALDNVVAETIMVRHGIKTAHADERLSTAIDRIVSSKVGFLPVLDDNGELVGDLTRDAILRWVHSNLAAEALEDLATNDSTP